MHTIELYRSGYLDLNPIFCSAVGGVYFYCMFDNVASKVRISLVNKETPFVLIYIQRSHFMSLLSKLHFILQ